MIGDWLQSYRESKHIENNIFTDDEDARFDVTIPNRYDDGLPDFEVPVNYNRISLEEVKRYFEDFLNSRERIKVINDQDTCNDNYGIYTLSISCDHCHAINREWMRHCNVCGKDMCELCFKERTEEDAKMNGATKWAERKDSLLACFTHNNFTSRQVKLNTVVCDVCGKDTNTKPSKWMCNRKEDKDLCEDCVNSDEGKSMIDKYDAWVTEDYSEEIAFRTGFGSILDWIPLIQNEDGDSLFYNMNPDSEYHHQVALSAVDNHGRQGYFMVDGTLQEVLERIKSKHKEFLAVSEEHGRSWTTFYNTEIKLILDEDGHQVHYG